MSTAPHEQYADLVAVGERMLWLFVPYAGLVLGALSLYLVSNHDLRAFATVAILGPFTLLRPWIIAVGAAVGLYVTSQVSSWGLTVIASSAVVLLGQGLDRRASRQL